MRRHTTIFILAAVFIATSVLLYLFHFLIFKDPHHIFIYMLGDLAFLPLEVFLVVVVIERILAHREQQATLKKLNMVIGAFFSEVGNELLGRLLGCFEKTGEICQCLAVKGSWSHADFNRAITWAHGFEGSPDVTRIDLQSLRMFLIQKRQFLLALLENPNLLEHERFTDLLWAVFHLSEELELRPSVNDLPAADLRHISGDIKRVYHLLVAEWLYYVEHLKAKYPFLFSLVARTHPFQEHPSPVVN
ncbi:MAG: hypothetical protein FJ022_06870 [Chloroflexi bacterium]|nr:hypothetical protein [Chloroflexota bacterium]MBM3173283.1 hypothetical protein [Chloroflexota bacterium]MBM3175928.1 hypothetical protein [Chloroflexota bacterium]MBM4450502.1 hypothetical protein [Chloroflexota bacterium]MBM4453717.1 hypothetical protein [Chloroflexota bacterium]